MTAGAMLLQRCAAAVMAEEALAVPAVFAVPDDVLAVAVNAFENLDYHATALPNNNTIETTTTISSW